MKYRQSVVLTLLLASLVEQKRMTVIFQNVKTSADEKYFQINATLNGKGGFHLQFKNLRTLDAIHGQAEIVLPKYLGNLNMVVMNRTFDYCDMAVNKRKEPLWAQLLDLVEKYGNTSISCPLYPSAFYIQDFKINDYNMPNFVPDASFRLVFVLFKENEIGDLIRILSFTFAGIVRENKRGARASGVVRLT